MMNIKPAPLRAKRRHLTLIEVLLVLTIVVMLGGVVGINVKGALAQQNFRNNVQSVVEQLRLSQELMLLAGVDIEISFNKESMLFLSEDKIDPRIDYKIQKDTKIPHIASVTFNGHEDPKLVFMSHGSVMPNGVLNIKGTNGEFRIIAFSGSPGLIQAETTLKQKDHASWDPLIEVTRAEIATPASKPA